MDRLTTWLELVGALLLIAAAAVTVGQWSLPGALATAGVLLIALSALMVLRSKPRRPAEEAL